MSDHDHDEQGGYKRPPKSKQFQKGVSGNPSGRRRKSGPIAVNVEDILNETFEVFVNGKKCVMAAKEIEIRRISKKAIEKTDFRSIAYLLALFEKHGCVAHPKRQNGGVLTVPKGMSIEMGIWLAQYGMPEDWTIRQIARARKIFDDGERQ